MQVSQRPALADTTVVSADANHHLNDNLTTAYTQVCTSYHDLEDFRTKVPGFLPLASGAGIYYVLNTNLKTVADSVHSIGFVGAIITLGLYFYELRALQLSEGLKETGIGIEIQLGILGQFRTRPHSAGHIVNNVVGSCLIYSAVFAGWLYLASLPDKQHLAFNHALLAFAGCLLFTVAVKVHTRFRSTEQRKQIQMQFNAQK
jgi:hypothetical protein